MLCSDSMLPPRPHHSTHGGRETAILVGGIDKRRGKLYSGPASLLREKLVRKLQQISVSFDKRGGSYDTAVGYDTVAEPSCSLVDGSGEEATLDRACVNHFRA